MDSFGPAPIPQLKPSPVFSKFSAEGGSASGGKINKTVVFGLIGAIILVAGYFAYIYFSPGNFGVTNNYIEPYTLVADKISQSASIVINLPKGITTAQAIERASFEPAIAGTWTESSSDNELVFQPNQKLALGKYYTATLDMNDIKLSKDFLVDEDPKIISVFPSEGSETNEFSKITIMFNRPMVPLTTLDTTSDEASKLVEITPSTSGKFKWISTRNLQFIPEVSLLPSSNYTVRIKSGFVSIEGLSVPEANYSFRTRSLRYENFKTGEMSFTEPVKIFFNQPIDLDRTKNEITVSSGNRNIQIEVAYGEKIVRDNSGNIKSRDTDKSILLIYGAKDKFSRTRFWDIDTSYQFRINRAYPLQGDININDTRFGSFKTWPVITEFGAESPRSSYVSANMFDPQGKLSFTFVESVDKNASIIYAPHLSKIEYGEKCKTDDRGNRVYSGSSCVKVIDDKKLLISFNGDSFTPGESVPVEFRKIVNLAGLQLNSETVLKTARVFPQLKIIKTVPGNNETNVLPTKIEICTNTPLTPATEDNFTSIFKTNLPTGKWSWRRPFLVNLNNTQSACAVGDFSNSIIIGLAPENNIHIDLDVVDDFGQKAGASIDFRTGKAPDESRNFYSSQKIYNVTSPDRTKLTYSVNNLPYVNLNICQVTPVQMLQYLSKIPGSTIPPSGLNCVASVDRTISLPDRYWTRNYFQVDLNDYIENPLGHYILTFSNPDYRRIHSTWDNSLKQYVKTKGDPVYEKTLLTVTNLAVQAKQVKWNAASDANNKNPDNSLYWVTSFGSIAPVFGAQVSIFQIDKNSNATKIDTVITDSLGIARPKAAPSVNGAIVSYGADSAIVSENTDVFQRAYPARAAEKIYIYTDRPIYRPSQEVFIKGLDRIGYDGDYESLVGEKAPLNVRNSRGEVVYQDEVTISEFGTFTARFILDAEAPLGTYYISLRGGYGYFDVEEYVGSAFKIDVTSDKEEYISGDTAKLSLDANYFFGVPVDGGEVTYSITSQDYYFDRYKDEFFNFGAGWYDYFYDGYGDKFITRGKTELSKDGKAVIAVDLDFQKTFTKDDDRKQSKIFILSVTAKNSNGQSVSSQKSFIVHRGEYYLGTSLDKRFFGKNDKFIAKVKSVDTSGKPVSISDITAEINLVKWEYSKRLEVDGGYYYQSTQTRELIQSKTLRTDSGGDASEEFSVDKEGEYEFTVYGKDARGNKVSNQQYFYVYGPGGVIVRPTNNATLDLATENQNVKVGDKVNVVIKSPYPRAKALITLERGRVFTYEIIDITGNLYNYTFTVDKSHIPNVFFSAVLLSPRPDVKYGQIEYKVNTEEVELNIDITSDKTNYLPGEEVKLSIIARDSMNKPVNAELSVAVADLSVLALKGNPKKNPVIFFYDGLPLTVMTASNVKNILYEAEIPAGTKGGSGGGAEPDDLARKKRGEFKDTALWRGAVQTDISGRAEIKFTLPDNLTTWQVESVGITKDTKLGVSYKEFTARKNVMVVPLRPRFIVPGDDFFIGAKVFNQTNSDQTLSIGFNSPTLQIKDDKEYSVSIKANDSYTAYFSVIATANIDSGSHVFTLSAKNKSYEDTVEDSIPITKNETYETVATASYTANAITNEYIYLPEAIASDRGGLNIKASATLAVFLSDALKYFYSYPYGCSEQIASKLSSIAIIQRGLKIENMGENFKVDDIEFEGAKYSVDQVVQLGLGRIYQSQTSSGGISYYANLQPNYYLTLSVLNALIELKSAGYNVDEQVIARASQYLFSELSSNKAVYENKDMVIISAFTLSRLPQYHGNSLLRSKIASIALDKKFINENISSTSLAHLAIIMVDGYPNSLKEAVFSSLENRLVIDSRGSHIGVNKNNFLHGYYETPIKNTALFLKAYVADKRDSPVLDEVVRWITRSRFKDGAWGSTNNTISVVDAFIDFLNWKQETASSFKLSILLNNNKISSFDFNPKTILQTYSEFLPISSFGKNSINTISLQKQNNNSSGNNFYYDMDLRYYLSVDQTPPRDEGFSIQRDFYKLDDADMSQSLREASQGDVLRGHITVTVPTTRNFVAIEDFIPAGMELVNFKLATEDKTLKSQDGSYAEENSLNSPNLRFRPDFDESHDDRLFLFKEQLPAGVYEYDYFVRALVPGKFSHLPAMVSELYFPENFGRTGGEHFTVKR